MKENKSIGLYKKHYLYRILLFLNQAHSASYIHLITIQYFKYTWSAFFLSQPTVCHGVKPTLLSLALQPFYQKLNSTLFATKVKHALHCTVYLCNKTEEYLGSNVPVTLFLDILFQYFMLLKRLHNVQYELWLEKIWNLEC